jgi:hypothetical protein
VNDGKRVLVGRRYIDDQVRALRERMEQKWETDKVAREARLIEVEDHMERLNNSFARADEALAQSVRLDVFTIQMQGIEDKYRDLQTTIRVIGMGTAALVLSAVVAVAGWLLMN